jgi:hypothetical protein
LNQILPNVVQLDMTLATRPSGPALRPIALLLLSMMLATACQPPRTEWKDIAPAPGAEAYKGEAEKPLNERLDSRISEQKLNVLGSRLEVLPPDVSFAQHVAWRNKNDNNMTQASDRATVPEPDAPVIMAEFFRAGRTLFVIGRVDSGRMVVLTALAAPR